MRAIFLVLMTGALLCQAAPAHFKETSPSRSKSTPGVEAAKAISLITGVAISPLLGVGAVGAWEYFSAAPERRARLPWYAQPVFWIPALLLVAMVGAKDVFGTGVPVAFKKPFDVAETIENKVSALVVAGAFVPLIANIFPQIATEPHLASVGLGFAAIDGSMVFKALMVVLSVAVFFTVFLAAHAVNILILLSPFSTVDAGLKLARLALLGILTGLSFLSPWAGAVLAILIIVASYFVCGWAYRLMIFGNVYVWDFVTLAHRRFRPALNGNRMFTARRIAEVPMRTYGKLRKEDEGQWVFNYRPWLILPERSVVLPEGKYVVGRGIFYPEIMRLKNGIGKTMLILPPRYRSHEEQLSRAYGLGELRDVGLLKGFKALWRWAKTLVGFGAPRPIEQSVTA